MSWKERKRLMMKSHFNQKFDIDVYFTIKYFADKHGKTITRRAKWTKDCLYGTHKKHGYPYIRYFDVDADGIRCASKSWEILT